jgi:hypothetical protein
MKLKLLFGFSLISLAGFSQTTVNQAVSIKGGVPAPTTTNSDTLFYTGSEQTWTVPCGATNISIDTYGAQGDTGSTITIGVNLGGAAGLGNRLLANHSFITNDVLYIYVGGQANANTGGFNGGGNGVNFPAGKPSGGGGGATDVRFPSNALTDRIQVSGGGGGGGNAGLSGFGSPITGGNGGNGGGNQALYANSLNGANGEDCAEGTNISPGAMGGTDTAPGAAALGCGSFLGAAGTAGGTFQGGNGGVGNAGFGAAQSTMSPSGGGGGGGYLGGNGGGGGSAGTSGCAGNSFGAGGGGAAGTNYFSGTPTLEINGVRPGNGMVVISYDIIIDSASIDEGFVAPCVAEDLPLVGAPSGGTWNVITGPNDISGGVFSPTTETTYEITYTVIDACAYETVDTITVVVNCDVTGLFEDNAEKFVIYPNPAKTSFNVNVSNFDKLIIEDMNGKVVKTINEYEAGQISVKLLKAGVYFVKITTNGEVQTQKLIIE